MWKLSVVLLCIFGQVTDADQRSQYDNLIVKTTKGLVRGVRYNLHDIGKSVDAFLGILFAAPPVGNLRFRHPRPANAWQGIYNATTLPNSCYQITDDFFGSFKGSTMWNPNTRMSEDCLYLNVWVPRVSPRLRNSAVLVWIHGGSFFTTTLDIYDGKNLAALNDIIVVSIAYRVGPLGFYYLGHPAVPGNAGMFDQLMALEWVQQNIRYFGGDPNNVTLFGGGAGAASVGLHLLSPLSQNLFTQAIMQSGTSNMPWATTSSHEAKRRGIELALDYLYCDSSTNDIDNIIACIGHIEVQDLLDNQWMTRGIMQYPFLPVVDGVFLPDDPVKILNSKNFKKCPILLGSNLNEGSYFLTYEIEPLTTLTRKSMTYDQFNKSLDQLFFFYPQYPSIINKFGQSAIRFQYSNPLEDPEDEDSNIMALDNAVGDCHFTCHINYFQHHYASAGQNVYSYLFTQRMMANPWPKWMGVMHREEISLVFGEPYKPACNFTEDEKELSAQMMRYWTNFAKTGDPNKAPGRPSINAWPVHTSMGKEYLELNTKYLQEDERSLASKSGLKAKECAFWKEYLPGLVRNTEILLNKPPPTCPPETT